MQRRHLLKSLFQKYHLCPCFIAGVVVFGLLLIPLVTMAVDTIKVGVLLPITGVGGPISVKGLQGAHLAVDKINQAGGILERPLEIIRLDSKSTPIGAQEAAQEAVRRQVVAVLGLTPSSLGLISAQLLQKAEIPVIGHGVTHPEFTAIGDYIFRVCYSDRQQGRVLAQFATRNLNAKTAVILINTSEAYSTGLAQVFETEFTAQGGTILWKGAYRRETLDYQDLLQQIIAHKPDITFAPGVGPDSTLLLKQAVNLHSPSIFLGGDAWAGILNYSKEGVSVPERMYFTSEWHADLASPLNEQFKSAYREQYGEELLSVSTPLMYDAIMLLADALARAQSTEPHAVRDALAMTKDFQGITGAITFDEHRDPINKQAVIQTFKNGKIELVEPITP